MSDADKALRALAANRGCRLVKSRVRTPGRRDHGKYGLKDSKTGEVVFGFSRHRLTATAEDVVDFLRDSATAKWKVSAGKSKRAARSGRR